MGDAEKERQLEERSREGEAKRLAASKKEHLRKAREYHSALDEKYDYQRTALVTADWRFTALTGVAVVIAVAAIWLPYTEWYSRVPKIVFWAIAAGAIVSCVAAMVWVRYFWSDARVAHEEAWLARLPFKVGGYLEVLAEEPREWPRLLVTVGFKDTAPSEENARGLVGRVRGAEAKLQRQEGRTMEFQSAQIVCPSGDSNSTNKNLYLWMKSFLTRVVLPLHDAHPVAEVHFRRD